MKIHYKYTKDVFVEIFSSDDADPDNIGKIKFKFSNSVNKVIEELESIKRTDPENYKAAKETMSDLFQDNRECVFIPANRGIVSTLSDQIGYLFTSDFFPSSIDQCAKDYVQTILKLRPQFSDGITGLLETALQTSNNVIDENQLNFIKMISKNILKGEYYYKSNVEYIRSEDGKFVKLNYASSSQQECVWILNIIFYYYLNKHKTMLFIEEPESHLDIETQKLMKLAVNSFATAGNNLFITTRNPYIFSSTNHDIFRV